MMVASFATIAQNQIEAIALIQAELLGRLKSGRIGQSSSELMSYLLLIKESLPLLSVLPEGTPEQAANITVNKLISALLEEQLGDLSMPIEQSRFDAAVAKLNELKSNAADDEANKAELQQAQAELKSAQEKLGSLQSQVDQLTSDDESDKAEIAKAKADLQKAEEAVAAAETKANTLIDQILPDSEAPTVPDVPVM
jgi:chromosome segregation ATPase